MGALIFIIFLAALVIIPPQQGRFKSSGYKEASGHSFFETITDQGRNGEFLTYAYLEQFGEEHKLLTKRTEENVRPFPGSEGNEPECAIQRGRG